MTELLLIPQKLFYNIFKRLFQSAKLGLEVNPSKCEIFVLGTDDRQIKESIHAAFNIIAPGIDIPKRTNAFLLGSPIHDESIPPCLLKKMEALRSYQDQLSVLSSLSAFYLTRLSLAMPRLNHFLRCSPTWKYQELLEEYDKALLLMLEKILNVKLSVDSYNQATLPVREGG